jgi:hypothetical protein
MMMIPGCVDAFNVVAAKLPVAPFLFNFTRGFNTRLRIRQNPTLAAGRFLPPPIHRSAGPCTKHPILFF